MTYNSGTINYYVGGVLKGSIGNVGSWPLITNSNSVWFSEDIKKTILKDVRFFNKALDNDEIKLLLHKDYKYYEPYSFKTYYPLYQKVTYHKSKQKSLDRFLLIENGKKLRYSTDEIEEKYKDEGYELFCPHSKEEYEQARQYLLSIGKPKSMGPLGIYYPHNGPGCCRWDMRNYALNSDGLGKKGWKVKDGSPTWWAADTTRDPQFDRKPMGEPNGDYTANAYLGITYDNNGYVKHYNDGWNGYSYKTYLLIKRDACTPKTNKEKLGLKNELIGNKTVLELANIYTGKNFTSMEQVKKLLGVATYKEIITWAFMLNAKDLADYVQDILGKLFSVEKIIINGSEVSMNGNNVYLLGHRHDRTSRTIDIKLILTGTFELTFEATISSERGYDYGYFYINGNRKIKTSGSGTNKHKYILNSGEVHLRFVYSKDGSTSCGSDSFKIKNLELVNKGGNKWPLILK